LNSTAKRSMIDLDGHQDFARPALLMLCAADCTDARWQKTFGRLLIIKSRSRIFGTPRPGCTAGRAAI